MRFDRARPQTERDRGLLDGKVCEVVEDGTSRWRRGKERTTVSTISLVSWSDPMVGWSSMSTTAAARSFCLRPWRRARSTTIAASQARTVPFSGSKVDQRRHARTNASCTTSPASLTPTRRVAMAVKTLTCGATRPSNSRASMAPATVDAPSSDDDGTGFTPLVHPSRPAWFSRRAHSLPEAHYQRQSR